MEKTNFSKLILLCFFAISFSNFAEEMGFNEESKDSSPALVEEIFVTGSLLPKGDFTSNAPIATISSNQFEMSNSANVESLINSMPQVVGGSDRSSSWGSGIATANLRGLGENRTLVLVNSRRFVPTFPDGGTVDLNFIPIGLIDRVEVLTGGASAAYGSDALAGVINIILKETIDGWEFNAGTETSERGDAEIHNFNFTVGGTFGSGKGQYMAHFDYLERKPLYFSERDISDAAIIDSVDSRGELTLIDDPDPFYEFIYETSAAIYLPFFGSFYRFDELGNLEPSQPSGNVNAFSFLQLPQERGSFKGNISYEFSSVKVYADLYYSKSKVPQSWPVSANTGFPVQLSPQVPVETNPFWSDQAKQLVSGQFFFWPDTQYNDANGNGVADTVKIPFLLRNFNNELGSTQIDRSFEAIQLEFGFKGDLNATWGYEVFAQLGEVESELDPNPLVNKARLAQGLNITPEGQCVDPSDGCVPVNIWSEDIGSEAVDFIRYPKGAGMSVTKTTQNVFTATLSGNTAGWFTIPGDPGPIGLVLGLEYLEIKSKIDTPEFIEKDEFLGFSLGPASMDAQVDTTSIFSEALIPLISGKPGIDFLELELGFRSLDHSTSGRSNTSKIALAYYPTADFQFRTSYNKAVRAPALDELFRNQKINWQYVGDPCTDASLFKLAGNTVTKYVLLEESPELTNTCLATGVPLENLYDEQFARNFAVPINQGGAGGGLLPEDAKTYSIGVVWTPYSIDGLSVSFDYFQVEIENYIETSPFDPDGLMIACYDSSSTSSGAGSEACNSISRDPSGGLASLFTGYQNLGLHTLEGWDINLSYGLEFFKGFLDINYFATKISKRTIEDDSYGDINFDCKGIFNGECDQIIDYPVPDFKHRLTVDWSRDRLDLQIVWRHISSLRDGDDDTLFYREKLDSYSLFDFSGRYSFRDSFAVTAGIRNVLDKEPQAIGSNSYFRKRQDKYLNDSNTYTEFYDPYGRTFFIKLSGSF